MVSAIVPCDWMQTDWGIAQEIEELKKESEALKKIRESVGSEDFPQQLFDKVFKADIERLRSMEDMWKTRPPPQPLDYKTVMSHATEALASKEAILQDGQKVWSLEENLVVFNDSLDRLSKRMLELKQAYDGAGPAPMIEFDKDDGDTLDFVAASANIRSTIFGIDRKSCFDIKQMAGNIIPAIATTNAIVAGLCVLQAFKVLRGEYNKVKEVSGLISFSNLVCSCVHLGLSVTIYAVRARPNRYRGSPEGAKSKLSSLQCVPDERVRRLIPGDAERSG